MDIVEELRTDREKGARRLEAEYKAGLMSLALRFCNDPGDAEELVNSTFATVVDNIDNYIERSAFFAWMCQILTSKVSRTTRRKSSRMEVSPDVMPEAVDEDGGNDIYRELDASLLREAIDTLSPDIRKTLLMHYFMDFSVKDVARMLAVPSGTVVWRLHYARQILAAKLGAAAKKSGAKALLLALALCCLTALGAAVAIVGDAAFVRAGWGGVARNSCGGSESPAPSGHSRPSWMDGRTDDPPPDFDFGLPDFDQTADLRPSTTDQQTQQERNMNATTLRTVAASAAIAAAGAAIPAADAETLTWIGGASGLMSVPSNWTSDGSHASPQPGDTMKFNAPVALAQESFDLGSAGLTFDSDYAITNHVTFSGSGGIVKNGGGDFVIFEDTQGTFSGDAVFNGGQLVLTASKNRQPVSFGAGKMVFTEAETSKPFLYENIFGLTFPNAIELRGHSSGNALQMTQAITLSGDIASAHDFTINIGYQALAVSGNVHAPGKTLTASYTGTGGNAANSPTTYSGMIDASFVKTGNGNASRAKVFLSGHSDFVGNSLTVLAGTNAITSAGYWGGTNVVARGSSAVLRLEGAQNLSPLASVELLDGGKLDLAEGCAVTVSGLFAGGAWVTDGTYTAADLPGAIAGAGSITVRPIMVDAAWCGGASGLWSAGSNWSGGAVPASGATVLFTNVVELLNERVDFGAGGVTVYSAFDVTNHVWFTGSGRFVKEGAGRFVQRGDAGGDFAGGAVFNDGVLELGNRHFAGEDRNGYRFFGRGPITLASAGSRRPYIEFEEWDSGVTNTIAIDGENVGGDKEAALYAHQSISTLGPITANADFKIFENYYAIAVSSIDAPGHTVLLDSYRATYNTEIVLNGPVDANVTKTARPGPLTIMGSSPASDNVLTLLGGNTTVAAVGHWGGSVSVSGSGTLLSLQDNGNLSADSVLSIDTTGGASVEIASGAKVRVGEFWVNGRKMEDGVYSGSSLPSALSGAGLLVVGTPGTMILFR